MNSSGEREESAWIAVSTPSPTSQKLSRRPSTKLSPRARSAGTWNTTARAARRTGSLSERERMVAELAARGLTDREIAARLCIGERTVETHLGHVYAKLGVSGRSELRNVVVSH